MTRTRSKQKQGMRRREGRGVWKELAQLLLLLLLRVMVPWLWWCCVRVVEKGRKMG